MSGTNTRLDEGVLDEDVKNNPEPQKAASHDQYRTHSEMIKEDARKQYKTKPEPKRRAARKQ